jgi:hypothetical protein
MLVSTQQLRDAGIDYFQVKCIVRSSLFWDVTQHRLVVTEVSVHPIGPIFKGLLDP